MTIAADYARAFETERANAYPAIDAFEHRCGYQISPSRLEDAARVLACPLKPNPPNWQHGRVIYAAARQYFATLDTPVRVLDIGTAKGFSALCLLWAMDDSGRKGHVTSLDVLDTEGTERRNTVAEVEGPVTLRQILTPWPESLRIAFVKSTGVDYLQRHEGERIHVAFVDGKHSYEAVSCEARLLAERQEPGDLVIFDDAQIDGVQKAVRFAKGYDIEFIAAKPERVYAIGVRRG